MRSEEACSTWMVRLDAGFKLVLPPHGVWEIFCDAWGQRMVWCYDTSHRVLFPVSIREKVMLHRKFFMDVHALQRAEYKLREAAMEVTEANRVAQCVWDQCNGVITVAVINACSYQECANREFIAKRFEFALDYWG